MIASTQVLSCRAEIEFEDPALEPAFAYLSHGVRQTLPTRKTFRYEIKGSAPYEVREDGDFLQFVNSPEDALFVVYSRIHRRTIERFVLSGWVTYHAGVACVAGRRLLLLGNSGVGKTTLSLRLLLAGHDVQGDELAFERCGSLLAMPRAFHLKQGIERDVPEVAPVLDELPRMEEGNVRALDPTRLGLTWRTDVGAVDHLVWIDANHGGETTLEARPPYRAIRRALRALPGWGEPRADIVASATRLGSRGGFRLLLGDARDGVACLENLAP